MSGRGILITGAYLKIHSDNLQTLFSTTLFWEHRCSPFCCPRLLQWSFWVCTGKEPIKIITEFLSSFYNGQVQKLSRIFLLQPQACILSFHMFLILSSAVAAGIS